MIGNEDLKKVLQELFYTGSGQPTGDGLNIDEAMQLITSEIEKAKVEARLEELQMLIGSGASGDKYRTKASHGFQTIQERIEELSKL